MTWKFSGFYDTLITYVFFFFYREFSFGEFYFWDYPGWQQLKNIRNLCCKKGKKYSLTWNLPEGTKTNPLLWWESFTIAIIHNISRKPLSLLWIYQTDCKHVFERNSHDETLSMRLIWRKRQIAAELMPKAEAQRFVIVIWYNFP